jgi:pyridoxal phosphate enzyme (YggS family)
LDEKTFAEGNRQELTGLSAITLRNLELNVNDVLCNLHNNIYKNLEPARLIAVTKTVSAQVVSALGSLGVQDIAENRVQVALPKLLQMDDAANFRLHWIGRLQTNKVKDIIDQVWLLHSLDRLSLAQEVERRAAQLGRVVPALVQVNIAQEDQKTGFSVDEVLPFLKHMRNFQNIQIRGLMAMMPLVSDEALLERLLREMRSLFENLRTEAVSGVEMCELSMGMSNDYEIAARCGATMVRVGTALYRSRT